MRQTWNLKTLYDEEHFDTFLHALRKQIFELKKLDSLEEKLLLAQELQLSIHQATSFAYALLFADTSHKRVGGWEASLASINSDLEKIWMEIDADLLSMSDEAIEAISEPATHFPLLERRDLARLHLDAEQEQLISDLAVDGYYSWGQLYESFVGKLSFPLEGKNLSMAQLSNKLSSSDRDLRQKAFNSYRDAYEKESSVAAQFLNHLAGFRLNVYKNRNWQSPIDSPLLQNRMSVNTLNSMWEAVTSSRPVFAKYMMRKAELLNVEKLSWFDLEAPLACTQNRISYEEGVQFIIDQFAKVSPKMACFAKRAVESNWIDSESRPEKKHGMAYFTFPFNRETRFLMNYQETWDSIYHLSYLLGHGFHCDQIYSLPELAQHFRRNIAETSSAMSELIVTNASIQQAKSVEEKIARLDSHNCRSLLHLLSMQARFLFESRFLDKRKERYLGPNELNALMLEAQQECFSDSLAEYDPMLWASKKQFFITDTPFYNFPYTFGCLLSIGIYERIKQDPQTFENIYIPLLHDSGMMTSEELVKKHLGVDIERPDFWYEALDALLKDVHEFLDLTAPARV